MRHGRPGGQTRGAIGGVDGVDIGSIVMNAAAPSSITRRDVVRTTGRKGYMLPLESCDAHYERNDTGNLDF